MRILLVEDDEPLGEALRAGLIRDGYSLDWLKDGLSAMQALRMEKFDIVVLDLSLPGLPGLDVLRKMRAIGIKTPVLILTARDAKEDRILGLDSGADDYLIK